MNKKFKKRFRKDFVMFYLGIGLYIFFLILWFLTLPSPDVVEGEKSLDNLSVSEQIDAVEESEQGILDESNYLRAVMSDNNVYCQKINDSTLKDQCFDEVANFKELVVDNKSEQDIIDESNFLRASMMGDVSFCEKIVNPDLRNDCIFEVKNTEQDDFE